MPVIGNEAEALEMTGKASDVDYIHANHDDLMKKYQKRQDKYYVENHIYYRGAIKGDCRAISADIISVQKLL